MSSHCVQMASRLAWRLGQKYRYLHENASRYSVGAHVAIGLQRRLFGRRDIRVRRPLRLIVHTARTRTECYYSCLPVLSVPRNENTLRSRLCLVEA